MRRFYLILISVFLIFASLSCQKKTSKTDKDTINEAIACLDEGRAQETIDILTPISLYNKSPRVMSILAAAYLYRSEVSTKEIIELFLSFSVAASKNTETENEQLKDVTQLVATLDDFFKKLAMVPTIKNKEQEDDLNTALFFLKSSEPATAAISLQKGLIRLILAKFYFNETIRSLLRPDESNKCIWEWPSFFTHLQVLLLTLEDLIGDLIEADPKKIEIWKNSRKSIKDTKAKIEKAKAKEVTLDPVVQDLFIYFLKSHSVQIGCEP